MDNMSSNFGIGSALHGQGHDLGSFSSLANSNGLALERCELPMRLIFLVPSWRIQCI